MVAEGLREEVGICCLRGSLALGSSNTLLSLFLDCLDAIHPG